MTKLDLRHIKLRIGDVLEREEELEFDDVSVGGQRFAFEPARPTGRLRLARATTGIVFTLAFDVALRGPCMRCLDDATVQLSLESTEYEAADASEDADELENPYLLDDVLDLSAWARDAVLLALPAKILCADECLGLCASCGRRLDEGACECAPPQGDSRWSKLEELRAELTE